MDAWLFAAKPLKFVTFTMVCCKSTSKSNCYVQEVRFKFDKGWNFTDRVNFVLKRR